MRLTKASHSDGRGLGGNWGRQRRLYRFRLAAIRILLICLVGLTWVAGLEQFDCQKHLGAEDTPNFSDNSNELTQSRSRNPRVSILSGPNEMNQQQTAAGQSELTNGIQSHQQQQRQQQLKQTSQQQQHQHLQQPMNQSQPIVYSGETAISGPEQVLKLPLYTRVIATMACLIIFIVGVCGNLLVPLVVIKTKYLRNSTNLFLINLSIADLLVLIVCMPTVFIELHSRPETWLLGESMCKITNFVETLAANGSICTILAISFERYYAICKPLKASYKCTRVRATVIIGLIWLLSSLLTWPILMMAKSSETVYIDGSIVYNCILETNTNWHKVYVFASMFAFFCLPLLVLMLVYWLIGRRLIRENLSTSGTVAGSGGSTLTTTTCASSGCAYTSLGTLGENCVSQSNNGHRYIRRSAGHIREAVSHRSLSQLLQSWSCSTSSSSTQNGANNSLFSGSKLKPTRPQRPRLTSKALSLDPHPAQMSLDHRSLALVGRHQVVGQVSTGGTTSGRMLAKTKNSNNNNMESSTGSAGSEDPPAQLVEHTDGSSSSGRGSGSPSSCTGSSGCAGQLARSTSASTSRRATQQQPTTTSPDKMSTTTTTMTSTTVELAQAHQTNASASSSSASSSPSGSPSSSALSVVSRCFDGSPGVIQSGDRAHRKRARRRPCSVKVSDRAQLHKQARSGNLVVAPNCVNTLTCDEQSLAEEEEQQQQQSTATLTNNTNNGGQKGPEVGSPRPPSPKRQPNLGEQCNPINGLDLQHHQDKTNQFVDQHQKGHNHPLLANGCRKLVLLASTKRKWSSQATPQSTPADQGLAHVVDLSKRQQMESRRQVVLMLAFVVVCFFLLFFPYRLFTIWLILATEAQVQSLGMETYYNLTYFSRILIYLHSAINPIAYNLISTKFRRAFTSILLCRSASDRRHYFFLDQHQYHHQSHQPHQQPCLSSNGKLEQQQQRSNRSTNINQTLNRPRNSATLTLSNSIAGAS